MSPGPDSGRPPTPHVVLGVCGGVAAYKAVELCRRLIDTGARVSPILTENATRFVGPATFAAVASDPPRTTLWDSPEPSPHTSLGQSADVIVVAPATARLIGSYASGLSDDLLSTTLLATRAPVVLCPAMHTEMWEHPAVQDNLALLRRRGVHIVEPESGPLAGGDTGIGRLADISTIVDAVDAVLRGRRDLGGVSMLVTAGGTREPIDPVRYVGNRSSGRQGHAVAAEAAARGAKVRLVTTSSIDVPGGVEVTRVETAAEMHDAVFEHLPAVDVVIMAAAVADFRPVTVSPQKVKKGGGPPDMTLEPTVDILGAVAKKRRADQVIVGFAAETENVEEHGAEKLRAKALDFVVANDVSAPGAGFEHPTNEAIILDVNGRKYETGLVGKRTVAAILLDAVAKRLDDGRAGSK